MATVSTVEEMDGLERTNITRRCNMTKCSINDDFGQCKNKPTVDIFGIELCDNHYHILFNMSDNIITKLPNKPCKGA